MKFGHGGNIRDLAAKAGIAADQLLDFSANINPLGPPVWIGEEIRKWPRMITHYPDPYCTELVSAASKRYRVPSDAIIAGNGSTEILYGLCRTLPARKAVIAEPAYGDYRTASVKSGLEVFTIPLLEEEDFELDWLTLEKALQGEELVFLGRPNNPSGGVFSAKVFIDFASLHPSSFFIIDEAFLDFVEGEESIIRNQPVNSLILLSLTKFYAVPGLRLGLATARPKTAQLIKDLLPPWSVNAPAQSFGARALLDNDYRKKSVNFITQRRGEFYSALSNISSLKVYKGAANFFLIRINHPEQNALTLASALLARGIAIRVCDNFVELDERYFRVAVRSEEENKILVSTIEEILEK